MEGHLKFVPPLATVGKAQAGGKAVGEAVGDKWWGRQWEDRQWGDTVPYSPTPCPLLPCPPHHFPPTASPCLHTPAPVHPFPDTCPSFPLSPPCLPPCSSFCCSGSSGWVLEPEPEPKLLLPLPLVPGLAGPEQPRAPCSGLVQGCSSARIGAGRQTEVTGGRAEAIREWERG